MDEGRGNPHRRPSRSVASVSHEVAALSLSLVLLSILPFLAPAVGLPDGGDSIGVGTGAGAAVSPSLAVDTTGALHLVYSDDVALEYGVYHVRSADGTAWGLPVRIDAPGAASYFPRIAVEREPVPIQGRVYVAYQVGISSGADVWFVSSDDGAVWSAPRRVDTTGGAVASITPTIAASEGGAYVAWADDRSAGTFHVFFRASLNGGATWGAEVQVSNAGSSNLRPKIDAKGGTVVLVWRQLLPAGPAIVFARSDDAGSTWRESLTAVAPSPSHNLLAADVYLDELARAHVVWVQQEPSGEGHVRYASSGDGLRWTNPVTVDDMTAVATVRATAISGVAGTLWVAWDDNRNGDYDVFASWSPDGATWGDGIRNNNDLRVDDTDRNASPGDDATNQVNVALRTGGYGVYAAWEDYRSGAAAGADVYFGEVRVSPLVITEIQDEPAGRARVEFYNFGRVPFPLAGVTLAAGASTVDLSPIGSAPPRSHLVVGAPSGSDLQAPLDLGTEGARVRLLRGTEVLASAGSGGFGIAPDPLSGEATARYAGTLDYAAAWTRATSPTFGQRNAVPPPNPGPSLVLNEVLYNPNQPADRFVELYYRGSAFLDLTGYRLVADAVYVFSGGVISASNPYGFLFASISPGWWTTVDAGGDNVYLYDQGGRLLDMVGWSAPHAVGRTLARTVEGAGGHLAYDDPSALANGWAFDQVPTLALVDLRSDARTTADIGTSVQFILIATNLQAATEIVNVESTAVLSNWPVTFRWTNGTALADSPADPDALPDLGPVGPGSSVTFLAEVSVPVEAPLGDGNVITASVSAAALPVARASVTLTIDLFPHLDIFRTVSPPSVYLEGSGPPFNEIAQVTVSITGAGLPIEEQIPHDVVWQIDVSGSMNTNDPANLRVAAVHAYIDGMKPTDRGSVIGFAATAWVVNGRPLTDATPAGKAILKGDADTLACSPGCVGGTNIDAALQVGNNQLITLGNRSRPRVEILLTDGDCQPPCTNTNALINQAVAEGIVIYTVGLGPGVNRAFLENIANRTGGRYYFASAPEDLAQIYREIGTRLNRTAGVDRDVTDNIPMVEDALAPYLTIVPGSFVDPLSGQLRLPEFAVRLADRTILQWNVSRIQIGETWAVRYGVTSTRVGTVDVALHPAAHVVYERWDGSRVFQPIPQATLDVLVAPRPPYITATAPAAGATDVALATAITVVFSEAMDTASVRWTVSPPIGETPSWATRYLLLLDHGGFEECTAYTVEVTEGRDLDGETLVPGPVPNPWTFTTVCPPLVRYTITRLPERGLVLVDGASYTVPWTFLWRPGDVHRIEAPEFDPIGASRFAFLTWSDGGARDHLVTVEGEDRTITARYALQHSAAITLVGLPSGRPARIDSTLFGAPSVARSHAAWAGWVDDGSSVSVDDLIPGIPGERYVTRDRTRWTASAPLAEVVRYVHQFTADVRVEGLEGRAVSLRYTAFGGPDEAAVGGTWSAWVDAGSAVSVDDGLAVGARERFRTLDPTRWDVDAPLAATVTYLHQFRPRVTLIGTDETYTVGAAWRVDAEGTRRGGLYGEWFRWVDAGSRLTFDAQTGGLPPRQAVDDTSFTVVDAFDAVIRYVGPTEDAPGNWKPLLALAYTAALVAIGLAFGTRALDRYVPPSAASPSFAKLRFAEKLDRLSLEEIYEKVRRDRRFTRLLLIAPFAGIEAAIGLASLLFRVFPIPEAGTWFPLGFWVNTAILVAGLVAALFVARRGYRVTEDDLLALAEAREGAGPAPPPGRPGPEDA